MLKKIVNWPFPKSLDGVFWRLSSRIIISAVGFISKFILSKCVLNTTHVFNSHILIDHIDRKPAHVPILTVANHASCFDDPGLWSILPFRHVFNIDATRVAGSPQHLLHEQCPLMVFCERKVHTSHSGSWSLPEGHGFFYPAIKPGPVGPHIP